MRNFAAKLLGLLIPIMVPCMFSLVANAIFMDSAGMQPEPIAASDLALLTRILIGMAIFSVAIAWLALIKRDAIVKRIQMRPGLVSAEQLLRWISAILLVAPVLYGFQLYLTGMPLVQFLFLSGATAVSYLGWRVVERQMNAAPPNTA